jgi:hypothetical protein
VKTSTPSPEPAQPKHAQPGDPHRIQSEELAGRLSQPDREAVTLARREAEVWIGPGGSEPEPKPRLAPPPWPISIWQPSRDAGERVWRRPEPLLLGDHYATRRELRPKTAPLPLRVVLFGESAAAGYLYAPHLTPSIVLESQLQSLGGAGAFEVIDLARVNECLGPLVDTVGSSLQINPDLRVNFAGNNWNLLETPEDTPYAHSMAERQRYA